MRIPRPLSAGVSEHPAATTDERCDDPVQPRATCVSHRSSVKRHSTISLELTISATLFCVLGADGTMWTPS